MPLFHPFDPSVLEDPHAAYRLLRDEAPAYYLEEFDCWFLSRFQDVWRASQEIGPFTAEKGITPFQLLRPRAERELIAAEARKNASLTSLDPPEHTAMRVQLAPLFRPTAVRELEAFTRECASTFIDGFFDRGECDIIADYGMRISVRVACKIGGLPLEDADWFVDQVNNMFTRPRDQREAPGDSPMYKYMLDFAAKRRSKPGEAAVDVLIGAEAPGGKLSDEDIADHLSLLVVGGTETLPKVLSSTLCRLSENPDQRREITRDPKLIPGAFEEALRIDMPTLMLGRVVERDVEFHGHTLTPGQAVIFLFASANRDEREFRDPDRFDIHRRAKRHLSFGHGTHRCLGANTAKMEGRVMLEEIRARLPDWELDLDRATRFNAEFFTGFSSLPIRF